MAVEVHLKRTRSGFLAAPNYSAVPDGTELNGHDGWKVYQAEGDGNGFYEIEDGEIVQVANTIAQLALWGHADVRRRGQCITAEVMVPDWTLTAAGLSANGAIAGADDHEGDIRFYAQGTFYDLRSRGPDDNDYGAGFLINTGAFSPPMTNGQYYKIRLGHVQEPTLSDPRGAVAVDDTLLVLPDAPIDAGFNDGRTTAPGIFSWGTSHARYRNIVVTSDYRITIIGLRPGQGFVLYGSDDTPIEFSNTVAPGTNTAWVSLLEYPWPMTGYIVVYEDGGSWTEPLEFGRWPEVGTASDIWGGDRFSMPSLSIGIQCNLNESTVWPYWDDDPRKLLSEEFCVSSIRIHRHAANPNPTVDTCHLVFEDPTLRLFPGKAGSDYYGLIRLGRPVRVLWSYYGETVSLFYGRIVEIEPSYEWPYTTTIRCESPLREIAAWVDKQKNDEDSVTRFTTNTQAMVIAAEDLETPPTGAVPEALAAAGIAPIFWQLDPTPDLLDLASEEWGSPSEALIYMATRSDSIWGVHPVYKIDAEGVDYILFWQNRAAKTGTEADHEWSKAARSWDQIYPRHTGDLY